MNTGYSSFTSQFKNWTPSLGGSYRPSSDYVNTLYEGMYKRTPLPYDNSRSLLDRGFDLLLTPLYSTAGFVGGFFNDDINPIEGFVGGLRAGNPFGKGYEAGEYTYSRVLEDMGWKPESTAGKIAKGTLGFVLDVALDPTTYLTGGTSALIKGTGRTAKVADDLARIANSNEVKSHVLGKQYDDTVQSLMGKGVSQERAEKYAYQKFWESASKTSEATHMTQEMAEGLILKQAQERGFKLTSQELARDSAHFASEYNRIVGIRDVGGGKPITFGVENLPFGENLAPKLGVLGKTVQLSDGRVLRELSDKLGISSAYSKLRGTIYGGKLGELFSTTSPLWRLSQQDPAKLYDFVKFMELTKGMNKGKLEAEKAIRDRAKAMNFTPAEQKEVLELLQDKTIWHKVKDTLKFSETENAKEIALAMRSSISKSQDEIDNILRNKRTADYMRGAVEDDLITEHRLYREMEEKYRKDLANLDLRKIQDGETLAKTVEAMRGEIQKIDVDLARMERSNGVLPEHITKLADDMKQERKLVDEHFEQGSKNLDDAPNQAKRYELIDSLSQFIFGEAGKLQKTLQGKNLDSLVNMVKRGEPASVIRREIENAPHLYSEHATEVYKYLAQKHGYKSWEEAYHKPMEELTDKLKRGEDLNQFEYQQMLQLQSLHAQRAFDFNNLFRKMTYEDFKEYRRINANNELINDLYKTINHRLDPSEQMDRSVDIRKYFIDDISASEARKYTGLSDNTAYNTKILSQHRHEVIEDMAKFGLFTERAIDNATRDGGQRFYRFLNTVVDETERLLSKDFRKEYHELTDKQKPFVLRKAIQNINSGTQGVEKNLAEEALKEVQRRASNARLESIVDSVRNGTEVVFQTNGRGYRGHVKAIENVDGMVKYTVDTLDGETIDVLAKDIHKVMSDKSMKSAEELVMESPMVQSTLKERSEVEKQINQTIEELNSLDGKYAQEQKALYESFKVRAQEQRQVIEELEETRKLWNDTYQSITDDDTIQKLSEKIARYENALATDEALETYLRSLPGGNQKVDDILNHANITQSAKISLDDRVSSDKVKSWVNFLYEEFKKIGQDEVSIGKLKPEQFEAMLGQYVPHILTPEGRKYIDSLKELEPHKSALTKDLGYGTRWNPYAQSRTIEGTIEEANQFFRDKLQGKNLFSENIADIYLTRAMKHTELMYDDKYMRTMMDMFGKPVTASGVEQGYKAVANYGLLKEQIREMVQHKIQQKRATGANIVEGDWDRFTQQALSELSLPSRILDDLATPMVELSQEQIAKISQINPGLVRQVNDAVVMKANQARKIQIARDENRFLMMYDKFLHWTKLNQTTVMPSFHMRNKMSNIFNNWLGVGKDAMNPALMRDSWKTVWHLGDTSKLKDMKPLVSDDGLKSWNWDDLYNLAKQHNVIDEGFFAKDIGAGTATRGLIKKLPAKYDPTDTINFQLFKTGADWGSRIENSDRLLHFASLLKQGRSIEESARSSRQFLFDYSDLTAFEANVMKRLIPYYTWLRKNGRLQVSQFVEQPEKFRDVAKVVSGIEGMNNYEDRVNDAFLANFAKDWVQTPFGSYNDRGERKPILYNPGLPYMDIGRLPDPTQPLDSIRELFTQTAPQIKVPIELLTNKNYFFDSDIVREGDNPITPRLLHIMRQLALWNAGEGMFTKSDGDLGRHVANTLSGVKLLSYDYENNKRMKIAEMIRQMNGE